MNTNGMSKASRRRSRLGQLMKMKLDTPSVATGRPPSAAELMMTGARTPGKVDTRLQKGHISL